MYFSLNPGCSLITTEIIIFVSKIFCEELVMKTYRQEKFFLLKFNSQFLGWWQDFRSMIYMWHLEIAFACGLIYLNGVRRMYICLSSLQSNLGSWILQWILVLQRSTYTVPVDWCQVWKRVIFLNRVKIGAVCLEILGKLVWIKTMLKCLSWFLMKWVGNSCQNQTF